MHSNMGGNVLPVASHERTDDYTKHHFFAGDPLISIELDKRRVSEAVLVGEALQQAAVIITVYAIVFILVAVYRLLKSDVTKKTA